MPVTAPTVGGTPTYVLVSFRYVDANGVKDAFSVRTTLARATNANVEAARVAVGAATNANVYEVLITSAYSSASASPAAATDALRESANDVIETLQKDIASGASQYVYIPAPLEEIFFEGTNDIDTANALYAAVNTAFDAVLPASFSAISVRFAEHKNLGTKTPL